MAKINVEVPAVNVKYNGEEYRKVERAAQAGDIVKITDEDAKVTKDIHEYMAGDIVELTGTTQSWSSFDFSTKKVSSAKHDGFVSEKWIVRATDEEVAAAKAALDPRNKFAKGDKVRPIAKTDRLNGYNVGDIYTVAEPFSDSGRVKITGGDVPRGYPKPQEIVKVTDAEVAEDAERKKWAKIGRKVNEYKAGDIVDCVGLAKGKTGLGEVMAEIEPQKKYRVKYSTWFGICAEPVDIITLVVPVEQRFDKAE